MVSCELSDGHVEGLGLLGVAQVARDPLEPRFGNLCGELGANGKGNFEDTWVDRYERGKADNNRMNFAIEDA